MSDAAVRDLARRAGIAVEWTDYAEVPRHVSIGVLRRVLDALGLPCETREQLAQSQREIETGEAGRPAGSLITATLGDTASLAVPDAGRSTRARLIFEDGTARDVAVQPDGRGRMLLPPIDRPGYHAIELDGCRRFEIAVAPPRASTIDDIVPHARPWALAVQAYGLRRPGDAGIGDMGAAAAFAASAAELGADALALSPTHALFTADSRHYAPYSPSNRLLQNPLYADARTVFGEEGVLHAIEASGLGGELRDLEQLAEVDWVRAARAKLSIFRRLFDDFSPTDRAPSAPAKPRDDFTRFLAAEGDLLQAHARFEALHSQILSADPGAWDWRRWPAPWRQPGSNAVKRFASENEREILFHCFLQWIADRSAAAAQRDARAAGMGIGLLADLAIGVDCRGSQAWARQDEILIGLSVGAPPDLFNPAGQNWGLTTYSPRALVAKGFAPFIALLRAGMRHAGGVRIDHAMGLMRLWVIPEGAGPAEGAYLAYPLDDLLRLIALESFRHRAVVVGEDLGTVPLGFRDRLDASGIAGMRVLWFERDAGRFVPPDQWPGEVAAMTSTHDLPTVAGWWRGADIAVREHSGQVPDVEAERRTRERDRDFLWRAFRSAQVVEDPPPPPDDPSPVVDAAVRFIARTPSRLALIPLEDALGLEQQPNVPGTINEHPNWRRRYDRSADRLLEDPAVRARLGVLNGRGG